MIYKIERVVRCKIRCNGGCTGCIASQKKLTDSRTEEDYRKNCQSRSDLPASLKTTEAAGSLF